MEDTVGTVKRPFLRKGTGLKRFYKDIDVEGYFSSVSPTKPITANGKLTERNQEYAEPVTNYPPFHPLSVLKSADSPKRNLNVRFSHEPIKKVAEYGRSRRALDFGDAEKFRDKENLNPNIVNNVSEFSSSDEDSESERDDDEEDAEGEWETEDQEEDDDDESVVQISDSLVEEVFKSILKAKADELLPKLNGNDPILHRQLPDQAPVTSTSDRPLSPRSMVERELEMFEKMERMTTNQSFCSTASTVQRFVHTELRLSPIVDTSPNEPPPPPQQFLGQFNHQPNVQQLLPQKLPPASASQNPNTSSMQSRNPATLSRKPDSLKYLQGLSQVRSSAPFQSHQANQKQHKVAAAGTTVQQQHHPPHSTVQQQYPPPAAVQHQHQQHPPPSTVANPAIENRKQELEQDDQYLRALLTMRIHQLESQIVLHRTENKRMQDVRTQLEVELAALEKKKKEFEVRQAKELEVIDDLKKRLKRDQEKLNKELTTTQKTKTTEEEAESELKQLRLKVAEQDKELKVRSGRWASSARNFKTEIEELKTENEKLQKCILELKNDKYKLNQRLRRLAKLPADDVAQSSISKDITPPPPKSADMTRSRPLQPLDKSSSSLRPPNVVSSSHALPVTRTSNTAQVSLDTCRSEHNREEVDSNGVRRIFSDTGECLEVHYPNGDIKDLREVNSTGASKYYFKEADSWEIIYPDGTETLQFGSGEVQTKFPNGVREIKYVTGAVRRIFPDGAEESVFPDKTLVRTGSDGEREIHLPNGQVEHHSKNLKMRIYPDGTEKVLYNDGSSLTRYSSGRQRFRNSAGEIVYDRIGTETTTTESPGNGTSPSSSSSTTVSSRPRI